MVTNFSAQNLQLHTATAIGTAEDMNVDVVVNVMSHRCAGGVTGMNKLN
jgi:hypothetical protein